MATLEMTYESLDNGIGYVRLIGRMDIPGVQEIDLKFTTATSTRRKPVIVDLSDVTMMTSMGLGMIISNAKSLKNQGFPLILIRPIPQVEKIITMSGLNGLLLIEHDFDAAIKRIKESSIP